MSLRENSFFVVLQSNSCTAYYPDNKATRFITKLPRELRLHGEWGVSLEEIAYPMSFTHVPLAGNTVAFERGQRDKNGVNVPGSSVMRSSFLTPGAYRSIEFLLEGINSMSCFAGHLNFQWDCSGKVRVTRICDDDDDEYHAFFVSPEIARILGFNDEVRGGVRVESGEPYIGTRPASLGLAIPNTMFVYTNICESYITGGTQTPLLRIIPLECDNSAYACTKIHSFPTSRYIPLIGNNFDTIEIDIRDEYGRPMAFERGQSTVTLQFKRFD